MWPFHTHKLNLIGKTYAPPITGNVERMSGSVEAIERVFHGCTTFVWKCADPACSTIMTTVVLGKDMS